MLIVTFAQQEGQWFNLRDSVSAGNKEQHDNVRLAMKSEAHSARRILTSSFKVPVTRESNREHELAS